MTVTRRDDSVECQMMTTGKQLTENRDTIQLVFSEHVTHFHMENIIYGKEIQLDKHGQAPENCRLLTI